MRFLSLFAGIGGFDLGLERTGHECAGQVEYDGFCRDILLERFPACPFGADDVRACDESTWIARGGAIRGDGDGWTTRSLRDSAAGGIDLLCGGFPCQDLSVAGRRGGLRAERSGLFFEIPRIAKILRPKWGLFENVPGLLSSHAGRDFWTVLSALAECWPAVGWRVLDSQHFGVPQRRRRVFIVCGPTGARVSEVLALTESGGGDSEACGEAGAGVAGVLGVGSSSTRLNFDGTYVADTLSAGGHPGSNAPGRRREDDVNLVHSLTGEGHDASEDGTGRGVPLTIGTLGAEAMRSGGVRAGNNPTPSHLVGVRRLTPLECERLQGFPDGWSCLCQPLAAYAEDPDDAAMRCECPDSPRYRALGNAVTVNVIEWIGRRLA